MNSLLQTLITMGTHYALPTSRYRERLPDKLTLKLGARVILCHNIDVDGGWVNGTLASVVAMHENCIVICKMNKPSDRYPVPRFRQKFEIPGCSYSILRTVSTPTSLCSHCAQDARYDSAENSCQTQRPVLCIWSGIHSTESCQAPQGPGPLGLLPVLHPHSKVL